MNERTLILYERVGCTLCEVMAEAVQRALIHSNIGLRRVNIDADAALKAKFDWDIPLYIWGRH